MTSPQPLITLAGDHVAIGPMRRDLVPLYQSWINNLETARFLSEAGAVVTLDEELQWYETILRDSSTRYFTIYALPDFTPIGTANLHMINQRHRKANFGISIGEPHLRGKGFGTEATRLVVDYGFNALNLNSIWLTTHEFNHAGRRAYLKAGFTECGRRRQCRFHAGRYWDEIHMDILASEFTGSRIAPIEAERDA